MRPVALPLLPSCLLAALLLCCGIPTLRAAAVPQPQSVTAWKVEDLRRGMKGHGCTVMKGTKVETFQIEILGVLRNTSPGRDLILARLSGLGLEKTGVIAGMSGSPVYVEDRLVGAVAYAWIFGKEPIAGITPFRQMHSFVEALQRREVTAANKPVRIRLRDALEVGERKFDAITVAQGYDAQQKDGDGLMLMPLRSPLAASGFTPGALKLLASRTSHLGLVPMQGGTVSPKVLDQERDVNLEP